MDAQLENRLRSMLDHFEVTRTLTEYCRAADRCDVAGMRRVYAKESWDDHGSLQAPGQEFARLISEAIRTTTRSLSHHMDQSLVTIDGDDAGAETYFMAVAIGTDERGKETCNFLGARFVDRLRREDGQWRIRHRSVVRDWTLTLPIENEWAAALALRIGQRSNDDPSCAVVGPLYDAE